MQGQECQQPETGQDRTTENEIATFLQSRYIGPTEAVWRLMEFTTNEQYSPVESLQVHLPGYAEIYYREGTSVDTLREKIAYFRTKLLAWFDFNANCPGFRDKLYYEFP